MALHSEGCNVGKTHPSLQWQRALSKPKWPTAAAPIPVATRRAHTRAWYSQWLGCSRHPTSKRAGESRATPLYLPLHPKGFLPMDFASLYEVFHSSGEKTKSRLIIETQPQPLAWFGSSIPVINSKHTWVWKTAWWILYSCPQYF